MQIKKELIIKFYKLLYDEDLDIKKKYSIFTQIFYDLSGDDAWKVYWITKNALKKYSENNFRSIQGIQRAHIVDRIQTLTKIFENKKLDDETLIITIIENDKTILMTKEEHGSGNISKKFEIDITQNLFSAQMISYKFRIGHEGVYLRDLYTKHKEEFFN
jgi:hypothetical protein|tara:strand:- start:328 stop:807 length:480 start_codon:yes stop_codon:yes gene_type:complete